jgi:hypothetical protein
MAVLRNSRAVGKNFEQIHGTFFWKIANIFFKINFSPLIGIRTDLLERINMQLFLKYRLSNQTFNILQNTLYWPKHGSLVQRKSIDS